MGRVGSWLAAHQLPIEPDIVTVGKGLGAGYAPLAAVLCREHVYDALAEGSRKFDLGHTWDGAPLPCAVGLAVLDASSSTMLVDRVSERGPRLRGARAGTEGLADRRRGARSRLPARGRARRPPRRHIVAAPTSSTRRRSSTDGASSTACS